MAENARRPSDSIRAKAETTKQLIEQKYAAMRQQREERLQREISLEQQMEELLLPEEERNRLRNELRRKEQQLARESRKRLAPGDFEPLLLIGNGAFGEVRLVRKRDSKQIFAMKTMLKQAMVMKNQVAHVRAERDLLAAADNPWVVKLHYSFQDANNLYMAMEYCPGGDLMGLLMKEDTFTEEATRFYAAEAILAIQSVHDLGYIHRDLKPDNLLIDRNGHLKLTDLGLCKKVDEGRTKEVFTAAEADDAASASSASSPESVSGQSEAAPGHARSDAARGRGRKKKRHRDRKLAYTTVGTPDYIAPEVLSHKGYGKECDWWSLGVILFECLVGYPPFYADDAASTCRNIMRWRRTLAFPEDVLRKLSRPCVDFITRLVCDARHRLGRKRGATALMEHPWFEGFDWDSVRERKPPYVFEAGTRMQELLDEIRPLPASSPQFQSAIAKLTENFDEFPDSPWPMQQGQGQASRMPSHKDPTFIGYTFKRAPAAHAVRVTQDPNSGEALRLTASRPLFGSSSSSSKSDGKLALQLPTKGFGAIDEFRPRSKAEAGRSSPPRTDAAPGPAPSAGAAAGLAPRVGAGAASTAAPAPAVMEEEEDEEESGVEDTVFI